MYEIPEPFQFPPTSLRHPTFRGPSCSWPRTVISVARLQKEIADCELTAERLSIDPQAIIIADEDRKFEEKKLVSSVGSPGQGVGSATSRKILRTAADPPVQLAKDIPLLAPFLKPTLEVLEAAFSTGARIFLEGTQGTGLSVHHGTYPYVTSRETSSSGCLAEAGIAPGRLRKTIMAVRTYPIRVGGNSGPMQSERSWQTISERPGIPLEELLKAERTTTTNRERRVAEFDWTLLRKAASLNGPTDIALTFRITLRSRIGTLGASNNPRSPHFDSSRKSSESHPHQYP